MSEDIKTTPEMDQFIAYVKTLTVMDLNTLVKALEKELGVSAAVMSVAGPAAAAPAAAVEEQTEFKVVLAEVPADKKITVIKEVRVITQLGLKEAKDLVEAKNGVVKEGLSKEDAQKIKTQLEAAGAKVELK
jgi:large subunit ribosomal protein L7/L12